MPVSRTHGERANGSLVLDLQGCQDGGICYPPMARRLAGSLPAGTITPTKAIEATPDDATSVPG